MIERIKSSYRLNKCLHYLKLQKSWIKKRLYQFKVLDQNKLTFPDFMIIGTAKSGTWWLAKALEKHPEIALGYGKSTGEIKYFDQQFHRSLEFYASHFPNKDNVKIGEKTPGYCTIPSERISLIKSLNPEIRLILMLRNPVDRIWSDALMMKVRKPGKKIEEISDESFYRHFRNNKMSYLEIIDKWLKYFEKEQLLICFYEEIKENPKNLLSKVFAHIGVSLSYLDDITGLNKVVNKGPGIEMPEKFRSYLEDMYSEEIENLYQRFGEPVSAWRVVKEVEEDA